MMEQERKFEGWKLKMVCCQLAMSTVVIVALVKDTKFEHRRLEHERPGLFAVIYDKQWI